MPQISQSAQSVLNLPKDDLKRHVWQNLAWPGICNHIMDSRSTPKVSQTVPNCPKVSQCSPKCPKESQSAPKCPKVPQSAPKCQKKPKRAKKCPHVLQTYPRMIWRGMTDKILFVLVFVITFWTTEIGQIIYWRNVPRIFTFHNIQRQALHIKRIKKFHIFLVNIIISICRFSIFFFYYFAQWKIWL